MWRHAFVSPASTCCSTKTSWSSSSPKDPVQSERGRKMSMLKHKIENVMEEPACAVNQAKGRQERKKGCTKQLTPGSAAGGCAFDGAKIALQPVVDVAHLVHGPIACEGSSWDNRHALSSRPTTYRTGFTTDITEVDVIFGGEKRLYKAITEIIEK